MSYVPSEQRGLLEYNMEGRYNAFEIEENKSNGKEKTFELYSIDNAAFQYDNMETSSVISNQPDFTGKDKKSVYFHKAIQGKGTKVDLSEISVKSLQDIPTLKVSSDVIPPIPDIPAIEACQPEVCKQISKEVGQMKNENNIFDSQLQEKKMIFYLILAIFVVWLFVHFIIIKDYE